MGNSVISKDTGEAMVTAAAIKLDVNGPGAANCYAAEVAYDSVAFGTDTFTKTAHGLVDGDKIRIGGTPPSPVATESIVFVRDAAANTHKVAATLGGAAIDLTDDGTAPTFKALLLELPLNNPAYSSIVDNVATLDVDPAIAANPIKNGTVENVDWVDGNAKLSRNEKAALSGGAVNFDSLLADTEVENSITEATLTQDLGSHP